MYAHVIFFSDFMKKYGFCFLYFCFVDTGMPQEVLKCLIINREMEKNYFYWKYVLLKLMIIINLEYF